MLTSVPALLLGMTIIAALGVMLGYLLEPGRFETAEAPHRARSTVRQAQACVAKSEAMLRRMFDASLGR